MEEEHFKEDQKLKSYSVDESGVVVNVVYEEKEKYIILHNSRNYLPFTRSYMSRWEVEISDLFNKI
jgi:hypothetical protein